MRQTPEAPPVQSPVVVVNESSRSGGGTGMGMGLVLGMVLVVVLGIGMAWFFMAGGMPSPTINVPPVNVNPTINIKPPEIKIPDTITINPAAQPPSSVPAPAPAADSAAKP